MNSFNALPEAYDGPSRIWLQWHDFEDSEIGVTWCRDKIHDSDAEYITVGLYEAMKRGYESQLARVRAERDTLLQRLSEMEYAVDAGNTAREPVPADMLRGWLYYVWTGNKAAAQPEEAKDGTK